MYPGTAQWGSRPDETQALRFKQIDSLRQFFPTVKEVSKESIYEVPVTLPRTRQTITIRITLVRDFPRVPPTLQILPAVTHKFVDNQMLVTPNAHENLSQWTVHTNLGKTVLEIVQKFMQDPPQIVTVLPNQPQVAQPAPISNPPSTGFPSNTPVYPNPSMTPTNIQPTVNPTKPPPPYNTPVQPTSAPNPSVKQSQIQLPPIPQSFPDLESKTPSELSHLLNDELEFNGFFEGLSCVQTVRKLRDDLRENNEALAKKSLALEAEIEKLKQDVSSRQQSVSEKKSSLDLKLQRQHEIMKQYSTANLIEKLGASAAEAENSSDMLAQKFLSGEIEQKDFVKDFMEKRKLYHLRAAKRESLLMMAK